MAMSKREQLLSGEKVEYGAHTIDLTALDGYAAVQEMRLINNSIKHNDGVASEQLAKQYPIWAKGVRMPDLEGHYEANKDKVKTYIKELTEKAFDVYDAEKAAKRAAAATTA